MVEPALTTHSSTIHLCTIALTLAQCGGEESPNLSKWCCNMVQWVALPCDPVHYVEMPGAGHWAQPYVTGTAVAGYGAGSFSSPV